MSKVDFDWVRTQFNKGKVTVGTGEAVLKLLEAWEALGDVPREHTKDIAEVFGKMIQGHALVEDKEGVWVDVIPGQVFKGDIVRVRTDAFSTDAGAYHNGRVGKVVDVRYGDVIFRSTDEGKLIDGAHYSPHHLQKLIK